MVRMVFWGCVGLSGVYVWQRGVEGCVEDLGWVVGVVEGEVRRQQVRQQGQAKGGRYEKTVGKGMGRGRGGWG